jgi:hypothetical protein
MTPIDAFLPHYDVHEVHAHARMRSRAIRSLDFSRSPVIRGLFRMRGMPSAAIWSVCCKAALSSWPTIRGNPSWASFASGCLPASLLSPRKTFMRRNRPAAPRRPGTLLSRKRGPRSPVHRDPCTVHGCPQPRGLCSIGLISAPGFGGKCCGESKPGWKRKFRGDKKRMEKAHIDAL